LITLTYKSCENADAPATNKPATVEKAAEIAPVGDADPQVPHHPAM
jgi:hypothetical protein